MLLVPRQLKRVGLTGQVPYYGGRMSPAQAYSAQHRRRAVPDSLYPPMAAKAPVPGTPAPPASPPGPAAAGATRPDPLPALQQLLDSGVLSQGEFDLLRARASA